MDFPVSLPIRGKEELDLTISYNSANPRVAGLGPGMSSPYLERIDEMDAGGLPEAYGFLVVRRAKNLDAFYIAMKDGTNVPPGGFYGPLDQDEYGQYRLTHLHYGVTDFDAYVIGA